MLRASFDADQAARGLPSAVECRCRLTWIKRQRAGRWQTASMLKNRLAREVTLVVAVKTIVILAAAFFVFGERQRPSIDSTAVEQRLMAMPMVSVSRRDTP
jgi:hypothetical protein